MSTVVVYITMGDKLYDCIHFCILHISIQQLIVTYIVKESRNLQNPKVRDSH